MSISRSPGFSSLAALNQMVDDSEVGQLRKSPTFNSLAELEKMVILSDLENSTPPPAAGGPEEKTSAIATRVLSPQAQSVKVSIDLLERNL